MLTLVGSATWGSFAVALEKKAAELQRHLSARDCCSLMTNDVASERG